MTSDYEFRLDEISSFGNLKSKEKCNRSKQQKNTMSRKNFLTQVIKSSDHLEIPMIESSDDSDEDEEKTNILTFRYLKENQSTSEFENENEHSELIPKKGNLKHVKLCNKHKRFKSLINNYYLLNENLRKKIKYKQTKIVKKQNSGSCKNTKLKSLKRKSSFQFLNEFLTKFNCLNIS